jgi:hypothetical protein
MMRQITGIKILRKFVPMTKPEQKTLRGQRWRLKSIKHGEQKTIVVLKHMWQLPEPLEMGVLYAVPAFDAEKKNHSLITRITTSLWRSCGFANHATSNGTKK